MQKQADIKTFSKPALFKDYNKGTKDLISKSFSAPGAWKIECKSKPAADSFVLNPQASSDGRISADVEFASHCGGSVKVNVTPNLFENVKSTIAYKAGGHEMEAVISHVGDNVNYEVSHNTSMLLNGRASVHEKLTKSAIELGLGLGVASNCQVGCGAVYSLKEKQCNWNFGCRYAEKGYEVVVRTNRLKTYQTSVTVPVLVYIPNSKKPSRVLAGFETNCGREVKGGWTGSAAVEVPCNVLSANSIKVRVDRDLKWAATFIAKVADNWTMAVTMDKSCKAGVLLTHG